MFEHNDIEKYSFSNIPIGEECLLISEIYIEEFSNALIKQLDHSLGNPYEVGYCCTVVVRNINSNSIDLSWYPDTHTRFHEVSISIPKDKFKVCVESCKHGIKPYIFIDHNWLELLYTREYSVFALVDAIGVKDAIRDNLLTKEKLLYLRDEIDSLATEHLDISFISFADSLILKSNWSVGYYRNSIKCSYKPESLLLVIQKIQDIYNNVLGLSVYSVLTQGSNEYYEEPLLHISNTKNHICLNSLGIPFAELLAIENAAKIALKSKVHSPAEIYMDEQYYHSLNFRIEFQKNKKPKNSYKAIMKTGTSNYFYSSLKILLDNLSK